MNLAKIWPILSYFLKPKIKFVSRNQRWLWVGFFRDPNSQIPNSGDLGFFFSREIPKAKSQKIPNPRDWDFFSSKIPKSQEIPKIYYTNLKGRINHRGIFVSENQKSQKIPNNLEKSEKKSLKSKRKSQEITAKCSHQLSSAEF